ncbi:MAG: hypothetical protein HGB18_04750 [Candidatus Moranbacteria bacterium]|nr:hypothetical protein [Candidatus Moranbacteria bacterium]
MGFDFERASDPVEHHDDPFGAELSGLCDIALGLADTPDYRSGDGSFPSIPQYVRDVFDEFERLHGKRETVRLAKEVADVLESESLISPRARSVRDTALEYIAES